MTVKPEKKIGRPMEWAEADENWNAAIDAYEAFLPSASDIKQIILTTDAGKVFDGADYMHEIDIDEVSLAIEARLKGEK